MNQVNASIKQVYRMAGNSMSVAPSSEVKSPRLASKSMAEDTRSVSNANSFWSTP